MKRIICFFYIIQYKLFLLKLQNQQKKISSKNKDNKYSFLPLTTQLKFTLTNIGVYSFKIIAQGVIKKFIPCTIFS